MAWKFFSASGTAKTSATVNAPAGAIMDFAGTSAPSGWLICDGQEYSQVTYADLYAVVGSTFNTGGETAGFFRVPDLKGRVTIGPDAGAGRVTSPGPPNHPNTLFAVGGLEKQTLTAAQSGVPAHQHANTASSGSENATHTHSGTTASQNANHNHDYQRIQSSGGNFKPDFVGGSYQIQSNALTSAENQNHQHNFTTGPDIGAHQHAITVNNVNNPTAPAADAHSSMQPYMVLNKIIKA